MIKWKLHKNPEWNFSLFFCCVKKHAGQIHTTLFNDADDDDDEINVRKKYNLITQKYKLWVWESNKKSLKAQFFVGRSELL